MARKQLEDRLALLCDDCNTEIFADVNMVMLNDELWNEVSDSHEDSYCNCCIEKRMGRDIEVEDFKEPSGPNPYGIDMIPCNFFYLRENKPEKFNELLFGK